MENSRRQFLVCMSRRNFLNQCGGPIYTYSFEVINKHICITCELLTKCLLNDIRLSILQNLIKTRLAAGELNLSWNHHGLIERSWELFSIGRTRSKEITQSGAGKTIKKPTFFGHFGQTAQ